MKNSTDQIGEDIDEDVSASGVLEENIEEDGGIDDQSIGEYFIFRLSMIDTQKKTLKNLDHLYNQP